MKYKEHRCLLVLCRWECVTRSISCMLLENQSILFYMKMVLISWHLWTPTILPYMIYSDTSASFWCLLPSSSFFPVYLSFLFPFSFLPYIPFLFPFPPLNFFPSLQPSQFRKGNMRASCVGWVVCRVTSTLEWTSCTNSDHGQGDSILNEEPCNWPNPIRFLINLLTEPGSGKNPQFFGDIP